MRDSRAMSKHRVAVLKVVARQLSVTAAAAAYGMSRQHLHRLLRRYREGGLDALEPRSRRPHSNPGRTPDAVRARIVALRTELTARGLDAGPVTIAWHLGREGGRSRRPRPSGASSTRPVSSSPSRASARAARGSASRPRHPTSCGSRTSPTGAWPTGPRSRSSWLDDHSRYLLGCTACGRVGGDDVVATFSAAGDAHGWPAATLTDNGAVYTSRFTGGRNGFEYLLAYLGIRQKNGAPGHPQTQGKIERFHQTLKRWLGASRRRAPWPSCRPGSTPSASPTTSSGRTGRPGGSPRRGLPGDAQGGGRRLAAHGGHFRLRYDVTDKKGAITLRRAGRLHHLKIGAAHARRRVLAIVDEHEVTVVALDTGEILSTHRSSPTAYWRNQRRDPGRWPGSRATGDSHVSPMSRLMCRLCRDS
jgi:transposase InsO family protein